MLDKSVVNMEHSLNILWSYAYLKNPSDLFNVLSLCDSANILIDSGAFTAYMAGKTIDVKTYSEFCKNHLHGKVWQYIALDRVKDAKVTAENLDYMVAQGLRPMPVFQINEDFSRMKYLTEVNPHVCVAGGVGTNDDYIRHRYQSAFKASDYKAKIHALGYLRFPDVFRLPLFSGDSCSFAAGQMWGSFQRFSPRLGVVSNTLAQVKKSPDWLQFIAKCGLTREDVLKESFNKGTGSFLTCATLFAHVQFSKFCLEKNFRYFFAIPNKQWVAILASVLGSANKNYFNYKECSNTLTELRKMSDQERAPLITSLLRKYNSL
jgi:hypothetical protein